MHWEMLGKPNSEILTDVVSVVTPAPVCVEKQESVFSVTGFLTFAVVSATAISNVISNIGREGLVGYFTNFQIILHFGKAQPQK